ncbi:uncharacterized protein LOC126889283 isoform X2 [Diabrotica virgifera virgifera]|uniref:Ig-like domain-containing protein n=1 Tax=Diabrotica virgifera virgifera TaxID=50390 RepID=A0ABM5KT44_DIAVI|nr:uncharacterized protein LOC126889283 isoform X2 [Diabrotica virgifera virgifera]
MDVGSLSVITNKYQKQVTNSNHKVQKRKVQLDPQKKHVPTVKGQTWSTSKLHCTVPTIGKQNVTFKWSKQQSSNEFFPLTTLDTTYMVNVSSSMWVGDDKRYNSTLDQEDKDWILTIKFAQLSDAGNYQCEICIFEKCSTSIVHLKLQEARAKIIGGPVKVIPSDKELPLRLSCELINSMEKPSYIFWYHGDRMINYDLEDGATVREGPQGSELIFQKANKTHAGNYSCVPSNARLDSVTVYYGEVGCDPFGDGNGTKMTHQERHMTIFILIILFCFLRQ